MVDEQEGVVRRGEVGLGLHNLGQQYGQAGRASGRRWRPAHFEQVLSASEERDAVAATSGRPRRAQGTAL